MAENPSTPKERTLVIRDTYKDRYLKEKEKERKKEKKNRLELLQRSEARFSTSPFRVNFIGLEEISELKREHEKKSKKPKKNSNLKKKLESRDQKFLAKLRSEVRQIENSKVYLDERKLEAALNDKTYLQNLEINLKTKHKSKESESFSVKSRGGVQNLVL